MTGFDRLPTDPDVAQHDLELLTDEAGLTVAVCSCEWESTGMVGDTDPTDAWFEHLGEQ